MTLGPQFEQLRMFMTAQEIKDYVNHSYDIEDYVNDDGYEVEETLEDMWDRKLGESMQPYGEGHGGGVYDALKSGKDLFDNPDNPLDAGNTIIELGTNHGVYGGDLRGRRTLTDRHHRIAAQALIDMNSNTPKYLPIEYEAD